MKTTKNGAVRVVALALVAVTGMIPDPGIGCEKHAKQKALGAQVAQSGGGGGGHAEHGDHSQMDHSKMDHSKHSMDAGEALKDQSIYHASGEWTDAGGKKLALSGLRGKPVVVAMAYTRCQYVCPRIVSDMKMIQAKLPAKSRAGVRFVFVSLDPAHDTPAKLKEYAAKHKLDAETWTLLSGDEDSVQETAALLGVKYKKESNGVDYAHSYMITLLDKDGVIKAQRIGAAEPKEKISDPLMEM